MTKQAFARPASFTPWPTLQPRPLLPIEPPPPSILQTVHKPAPPSPSRHSPFSSYILTTHLIPSAFPRTSADIPEPKVSDGETREERKKRSVKWTNEMLEMKKRQENGEILGEGSREVLWNCLGRYVRTDVEKADVRKRGLTVFCAHANGMHKETFEPMLSHILSQSHPSYHIDEIWTWDAIQHGDSGLINGPKLCGIFDWADNARDILNFFLNYLPETVSSPSSPLPTHLERVQGNLSKRRAQEGLLNRTLVCLGHSFGGASLVLGAYNYPTLFSSLVLVDPVIFPAGHIREDALRTLTQGALARRESWASRGEAKRLLLNSPFFARWDASVLQSYIEHGMTLSPDGNIRLKTTGLQEAVVFAEDLVPHEAWNALHRLDERIALKWIMPGQGAVGTIGPEYLAQERVWLRPRNATNVRIPGAGHLAVQEKPKEVAEEVHAFLEEKYSGRDRLREVRKSYL